MSPTLSATVAVSFLVQISCKVDQIRGMQRVYISSLKPLQRRRHDPNFFL
jgi:hypothetical protein